MDQNSVKWDNGAHFFAIAANAMRRILIDHARAHQPVSLDTIRSAPKHSCSKPFISVMKPAELQYLDNPSGLHNRSRHGTFLPQTQVRARLVIIIEIRAKNPLQMTGVQNDEVV